MNISELVKTLFNYFPSIRGRLGSTLVLFFGVGLLLSYIFGAFLPYFLVPWVSIPFSMLFLFGFYHVPETPLYLLKIKKFEVRLFVDKSNFHHDETFRQLKNL